MRMIKQDKDSCVWASLAMVLNERLDTVVHNFSDWDDRYPFAGEWSEVPRVPSVHEICDIAYRDFNTAFVPFEYDPEVFPHENCPPIKVWTRTRKQPTRTPRGVFESQLSLGPGLIEGINTNSGRGHMVAWDRSVVYDPRGYCYSINVTDKFDFQPRRFWLAVAVK